MPVGLNNSQVLYVALHSCVQLAFSCGCEAVFPTPFLGGIRSEWVLPPKIFVDRGSVFSDLFADSDADKSVKHLDSHHPSNHKPLS